MTDKKRLNPWNGQGWKGYDGEADMTDDDWAMRCLNQGLAMMNGLDPFISNADENGKPTGGIYEDDWSEEEHAAANKRLDDDEYYEAQMWQDMGLLGMGMYNRSFDEEKT